MSAKFLHAFADENPTLQKQIGCMNGIFQMFDRHHFVAGRRLNGHNHKRLPSGRAISTSCSVAEHNIGSPQLVLEKNLSKSLSENQRVSMESSRTSFSSSSCSSFSSLECTKSAHQESLSFDRMILDKSLKNSPKVKVSDAKGRPPRYEPRIDPANAPARSRNQSLDFRDVVKDSINRDSRSLSVKTSTKDEVRNKPVRHRDSPRPMQLSKSLDGSYVIGVNGKSREPADLNESLRVLVKLKEVPWNFSEVGEAPRSSFEKRDASFYPVSREARRFSYEGREISRQSLDSRDYSKPASKLRELPRLSLDSREGSLRSSDFDSNSNSNLKDLDKSNTDQRLFKPSNFEQELGSHKSSTSVVAKLMGLEAMPSLSLATEGQMNLAKFNINEDFDPSFSPRTKSSKAPRDSKFDQLSYSPKCSLKKPVTPQMKDPDSVVKPLSNSRVPFETAPWRQQERLKVPLKSAFGYRESQLKQRPESVYSEIEKRLKELEFRQSNKDLRALKQILDAMQAKGLLETKKPDHTSTGDDQKLRSAKSSTPKAFESPIVIMKPARTVYRSGLPSSSVIPLEGLSGLRKLRTSDSMDKKKAPTTNRIVREQTPKASPRELSDKKTTSRIEESSSQKAKLRALQGSSRHLQLPRENGGSSVKTSNSLSPRLQQRKLETERRSRPPIAHSDSSKPQRPAANRQPLESVSPRGRLRRKQAQVNENDDRLSENSESRNLSYQGDEISQRSDTNISLASQLDIEVTSADRSADMNSIPLSQGSRSPSRRAARKASSVLKQKKSLISLIEDVSTTEIATAAPEQPSPISVLDASFYQDDLPPSPVKKSLNGTKDEKIQPSDDTQSLKLSSEINHKKLQSIENLLQKLRDLSSTDDEPPATDHIASLCETQNPDHRYVSEILLASGLLLKDLNSGPTGPMPIQLHPSGHPINPDLFLVLEQTKRGGWLSKAETITENTLRPVTDQEKLHRKLVFDVVNEVIIQKLELTSSGPLPDHLIGSRKLTCRIPSGQQLLKELCSEIEQLQAENFEDDIKISDEEVLRRSEAWADFGRELPDVVLDIERLIFKDLIDEVVSGEAVSSSQSKSSRRRRQLFAK